MYYLNSRYYNPEWGRYLNADALGGSRGDLLSHNVFAYCKNNPVNNTDPSGYSLISILSKINQYVFAVALTIVAVANYNISGQNKSISNTINNAISNYKARNKAVSQSKSKAKDIATTNKKNEDTTKLYRSMDYVEYNRFTKSRGRFSNTAPERPNIMDTKWFATNPVNANKWGMALNPNGYKIVEITIPTKALSGMYYNPYLDNIGPAYNGTVPYMNAIIIDYRTVK